MDVYRVSFFGHRTLYSIREIEDTIERMAKELISTKEFVEFYVGRNGDYDICVASAVKRAQSAMEKHNSALILVLPYVVKDMEYYKEYYDEIVLPVDVNAHFKAAITKRNQWMVENSNLVVVFVQNQSGGAYRALQFARKYGIEAVNLGRYNMLIHKRYV